MAYSITHGYYLIMFVYFNTLYSILLFYVFLLGRYNGDRKWGVTLGGLLALSPSCIPFVFSSTNFFYFSPPYSSVHAIKTIPIAMSKKRSRHLVASNSGTNKGGTGDDGSKHRNLSKLQSKQGAATGANYYKPKQIIVGAPIDQLLPQERIDLIAELSESILEDPATALTSSRTTVGGGSNTTATTGSKGKKQHRDHGEKETDANNDGSTTKKEPLYHKTQSKMNQLLDLASISHNGHDAHAARLALLSLLAIFQDILPSYRIRLPTESEMDVRVSKETKATWDYERKLLQSYQKYLQLLERTWDDGKFGRKWATDSGKEARGGGQPPTTLAATSILAISALLQTCYNFNFRSNLLHIVTRQANHRTSEEVRISCCNALSTMFTKDVQGEASLEAVRFMAKMIKQQSSSPSSPSSSTSIHPDLVNTWLSLPLRVHEDEAMAAKLASAAKSKKAKKSQEYKDTLDIEKEMKEGEASVDKIELAKNQADTLHAVTITYFRILKLVVANTTSSQEENVDNTTTTSQSQQRKKTINASSSEILLLPCALRGLAKFSHLIHLDAMVNLLAVLKDLLKNVSSLPTEAATHCILCALKTLRGSGRETLPVDPKEYLIPLYNLLPRLGIAKIDNNNSDSAGNSSDKTVEAAIQCLDHAFLQRRELSMARLAAFIKRIVSTSLHCQPHLATPLLASSRQISARYSSSTSSKIGRMLENEEDIVAEGMFSPDAQDPEHSNAHATSLWELALMKYSVNPKVAEHSLAMAEGKLLKLPGEAPGKIWTSMDRDVKEGFISYKVVLKKHPLDNTKVQSKEPVNGDSRRARLYEEAEMSRKKRRQQLRAQNQIRFITPRRTGNWHFKQPTSHSML